jgi:tubulin--tyrosine ligase-like protein 12
MGVVMGFEEFQQVHAVLLASAGVPASLHRLLFEKLSADVFDGGSFFRIEPCEDGVQQRRLILSCESMAKNSNVFLIDHAWSFRLSEARKQVSTS